MERAKHKAKQSFIWIRETVEHEPLPPSQLLYALYNAKNPSKTLELLP